MKKRYGQHLLVDKNHLQKIVNAVNLSPDDIVIEIGAGNGLLTSLLAQKAKTVFAVEVERDILKKLKENINLNKLSNVEIIDSDFLKLDLRKITTRPFIIVGNIPYNITSKILIKLFGEIDNPACHLSLLKNAYLMLQKEVARRIVAKVGTKEYSPLTLMVQYFAEPKILHSVPCAVFYPPPKVDSAFVAFYTREKLQEVKNPALLKSIIRTSFQQRRKMIINSLGKLFKNKSIVKKIFNQVNLDPALRAEDLSFNQYLTISNVTV